MLGVSLPKDRKDENTWKDEASKEPLEPSGYVEYLTMYALDFEEFCWANNVSEEHILEIRNCLQNKKAIEPAYMDRFQKLFRDFILVGGMPEAVNTFVNTKDYSAGKSPRQSPGILQKRHKSL